MNSVIKLKRPLKRGTESRASTLVLIGWLLLWAATGTSVLVLFGEMYGFTWGLLASGAVAVSVGWSVVTYGSRKKGKAELFFLDQTLRVVSQETGTNEIEIDLAQPHRVLLIREKAEGRILLRVDQVDETFHTTVRLDILGPLPMVLPMRPSADARSLIGFEPGVGRSKEVHSPFQIDEVGRRADALTTELLAHMETYRDHRKETINLKVEAGAVTTDRGGFTVQTDEGNRNYPMDGDFQVLEFGEPLNSEQGNTEQASAAIYVALVPGNDLEASLVFQLTAPADWLSALPDSWEVPDKAMSTRVILYDDTPGAFVAARRLRRILERLTPSSSVLEILRH